MHTPMKNQINYTPHKDKVLPYEVAVHKKEASLPKLANKQQPLK